MDMQSNDNPGFFTLGEFCDKKHEKSDLHLVMERDENKGKARIWAMLPVEEAEILVEKRKQLDQESMPSDSDEDALVAKKAPMRENKAKKKKANGGAPAATAKEKKANGGAPAATVKAAAANTKKKAVEKRKKLDQEIMPSDSDEDVLVPKKAPRKEDRRWLLEEQQQRRKAERSAGPEEECNGVAPAVVAAHPDEAEERRSAQAEGRGVAGAVAAATAQQKNEVATAHQPTKNFGEECHLSDPAFWASIDAMVADHASHVTVHNKLDTPSGGNGLSVSMFSACKKLATPSNLFSPRSAVRYAALPPRAFRRAGTSALNRAPGSVQSFAKAFLRRCCPRWDTRPEPLKRSFRLHRTSPDEICLQTASIDPTRHAQLHRATMFFAINPSHCVLTRTM
jgi:hypothetical protein